MKAFTRRWSRMSRWQQVKTAVAVPLTLFVLWLGYWALWIVWMLFGLGGAA